MAEFLVEPITVAGCKNKSSSNYKSQGSIGRENALFMFDLSLVTVKLIIPGPIGESLGDKSYQASLSQMRLRPWTLQLVEHNPTLDDHLF